MYVENMRKFVEDAQCTSSSDYKHDFGLILTEYELEVLKDVLGVFLEKHQLTFDSEKIDISKEIFIEIVEFLRESKNDEGGR